MAVVPFVIKKKILWNVREGSLLLGVLLVFIGKLVFKTKSTCCTFRNIDG